MKVVITFDSTSGYFDLKVGTNQPIPFKTSDYQFYTEGSKVGIRSNDKPDEVILDPQPSKDWNDGAFADRAALLSYLKTNFKGGGDAGSGGITNISERDARILANALFSPQGAKFTYYSNQIPGGVFLPVEVSQQGEPNQIINITNTNGQQKNLYMIGNPVYNARINQCPNPTLQVGEYLYLNWYRDQNNPQNDRQILFGNNLGPLPANFNLGDFNTDFYIDFSKQNFGQQLSYVSTDIEAINNSSVASSKILIQANGQYYKSEAYKVSEIPNGHIITNHFNIWDYIYPYWQVNMVGEANGNGIKFELFDSNDVLQGTQYAYNNNNYQGWNWIGQVYGQRTAKVIISNF